MSIRLINISKDRVSKIDKQAPIVSIHDYYTPATYIPNRDGRDVLALSFFPGDHAMPDDTPDRLFTKEKGEQLLAFCDEQKAKGVEAIYIQCGEGRIRSYTLCMMLMCLEGFTWDLEQASIKQGVEDKYTARILARLIYDRAE